MRPKTHHVPGDLVADQIRRGRELVQRLLASAKSAGTDDYDAWHTHNERLLRSFLTFAEASAACLRAAYRQMSVTDDATEGLLLRAVQAELRALEFLADHLMATDVAPHVFAEAGKEHQRPAEGRVLVVYGRNEEVKEKVARFLMKLGLEPVLLEEQAAHGRTLIEKLEGQSSVDFAIVLLTGDDVGALGSATPQHLHPRARQNVIFELGYSIAKLSRECVCALYEEGVELPSDFRGVEYKPLDAAGAWKSKLAKELYEAGFQFDPLNAL